MRDTKSADLDYDDIDVSVDEYTLQPQMYESLTIKTKQITAVHEIGHMLGLEHPLVGVYHPNTDEEYGTTEAQREGLMGTGMWFGKKAFNKVFCSRISSVSTNQEMRKCEWEGE